MYIIYRGRLNLIINGIQKMQFNEGAILGRNALDED